MAEVIDLTQLDDAPPPPPPRRKKKRARDEESDDDVEITHVEKRERKATTGISTDEAKQRETLEKTPAMRRGGVGAPKSPLETAEAKWRAAGENAKSRLVRKLFCGCVARGQLDEWRWKRDRPDEPLWDMLAACADEFWGDAVSEMYDAEKAFLRKPADERRKIFAVDPSSGFAFADLLWGVDEYFFLRNRLALYAGRNAVADAFSKIESSDGADGVECGICCDTFALTDSVPCEGDELHWFCKPCFRNYLTVTGTKGAGAAQVKCPSCKALVGTDHVKGCLSAWELEDLEARAAERDAAVALRSDVAARLECVCGARGVVLKGDEPEDGIVQCPGLPGKPCERSYCIKCGAHAHPGKPCEDVDEDDDVLKALGSDTKRCPACGNGITKVGGCNHVLCAPPGGCGKSFCFICLQPHESHDPAKCRGGQQAHDLMMAHNPTSEAETMRRHAAAQLDARRRGVAPPQLQYVPMPPAPRAPRALLDFQAAIAGARARLAGQRRPPPPQRFINLRCPAGARPGSNVEFTDPDPRGRGQRYSVVVPAGVVPGQEFRVPLPGFH